MLLLKNPVWYSAAMKKPLTKRQATYVDEKLAGRNPSVILGRVEDLNKNPKVQRELQVQQQLLAEEVEISRADVLRGLQAAINRAQVQAEPATEIAGWKEIAKILGYYAPEKKQLVLSEGQDKLLRKLESLPTEELLKLAERRRALLLDAATGVVVDED